MIFANMPIILVASVLLTVQINALLFVTHSHQLTPKTIKGTKQKQPAVTCRHNSYNIKITIAITVTMTF